MRQAQALLAKWFGMQPSEINNLDVIEFTEWVDDAIAQIEERARAIKQATG